MTTPAVGQTSQTRVTPYISPQMFASHARRGVQVNNLAPGQDETSQLAALVDYIAQASALMNSFLLGTLAATTDTEVGPVTINPQGYAIIVPRYRPIIALTALSLGPNIAQLTAYTDLSAAAVELNRILVPVGPYGVWMTNQGPLQLGRAAPIPGQMYGQWSTCNGYPVTSMTASAAADATQIEVADTTGILAGQTPLTIQADRLRIRKVPTAVSTASPGGLGTGPGTLTFATAIGVDITNDAAFPTQVDALPADVIQAAVMMTRGLIKKTSGGNISSNTQSTRNRDPLGAGDDMAAAYEMIDQYQMVQR
ncbi:MAG TPA: hypothetical protein VFY84_19170 [Jiangellales bacterium]|nr:hypothetical protein [Jiangellales bacterium]